MTSISYELAKKLKNAGWTQPETRLVGNQPGRGQWAYDDWNKPETHAYAPSLSELIAACAEEFATLKLLPCTKGWAVERFYPGEGDQEFYLGSTPEEATARLWLKLQESKT